MDIDAQNAQIEELNDAKIQQIKAQRKLFGGIIKKGDPLLKNIINIILFSLLLPCMIIFELTIGGKNLFLYFLESLISFTNFIVYAFRCSKQFLIANYYFVLNWIMNICQSLINQINHGLTICFGYIAQKFQEVKIFIKYFCQLFINYFILIPYQWIMAKVVNFIVLCPFYYKSLLNQVKTKLLQFTGFTIDKIIFVIIKIKQITVITYKAIIYLSDKFNLLISCCWFQMKKITRLFYESIIIPLIDKITFYCVQLLISTHHGMIKLSNAISNYASLVLNYLIIKFLYVKKCIQFCQTFLQNCLEQIENQLIYCSSLLLYQVKIRLLQFGRFLMDQIQFTIFLKIKQFITIAYKPINCFIIYLNAKLKQLVCILIEKISSLLTAIMEQITQFCVYLYIKACVQGFIIYMRDQFDSLINRCKSIIIPIFNKITFYCVQLFIYSYNGAIKLSNAVYYYTSLILKYLKIIFLYLKACVTFCIVLLKNCMISLKNHFTHYSLLIIDYGLEKYNLLKENFITPFILKIIEIYQKTENFMICLALKTFDIIKLTLMFVKDKIIVKLIAIIVNYYCSQSILFLLLQNGGKKLFIYIKQIYDKIIESSAAMYEKICFSIQHFQQRMKVFAKIISYYTNTLSIKISEIARYCIQKITTFTKFTLNYVNQFVQLLKRFIKQIFKLIMKVIKWIVELYCRIILKLIMSLRVLTPIFNLVDQILDMVYIILSEPIWQFNKIIDQGIDYFIYTIPKKFYFGVEYLQEKLIQLVLKLEIFIEIIVKQSKKITNIIYQKLINPFLVCCYQRIINVSKFIIQQVKNFKDMIKYNCILPVWTRIRIFGVIIKDSFIKIKQKIIQIIKQVVNLVKFTLLLLKDQILAIKKSIGNHINFLAQNAKRLFKLLLKQIKLVYGILIDSFNQYKNQIIISLKQKILTSMKIFREIIKAQLKIIVVQFKIIKETIQSLITQVKQSMIEQLKAIKLIFKNIHHQYKQSLIQIKIQMSQQMAQIKQFTIQLRQATANEIKIMKKNIKMQGIQVKESIVTIKNDLKYSIVSTFKRS